MKRESMQNIVIAIDDDFDAARIREGGDDRVESGEGDDFHRNDYDQVIEPIEIQNEPIEVVG